MIVLGDGWFSDRLGTGLKTVAGITPVSLYIGFETSSWAQPPIFRPCSNSGLLK